MTLEAPDDMTIEAMRKVVAALDRRSQKDFDAALDAHFEDFLKTEAGTLFYRAVVEYADAHGLKGGRR